MKNTLTTLFAISYVCFFACKRPAAQEIKALTVTGTVFQTEAYCGGAAPNPQRVEEMRKPKPLGGKTVYIKAGTANSPEAEVLAEVTSNDSGEFSLSLEPGWYVMVDERRVDRASYNYMLTNFAEKTDNYGPIDKKCLDNWVTQADLVFEVKADSTETLSVTFHKPCSWNAFPCVTFIGERPR